MAIVGLVSLSVASVRIALPGKGGKIGYGIIMGATTVLFCCSGEYTMPSLVPFSLYIL